MEWDVVHEVFGNYEDVVVKGKGGAFMSINMIDNKEARRIATEAYKYAGDDVLHYAGWYGIWCDDENDMDYCVAINKDKPYHDDERQQYMIYISPSGTGNDYGWWDGTDTLGIDELANKLLEIAKAIDVYEAKRR